MITSRPAVGRPVPDVTFLDRDGAEWHLRDHLGTTVVLIFHRHIH